MSEASAHPNPAPPSGTSPASRLALWLAAAWIAAGALFKLLAGSPNDLPPVLHKLPIGADILFPSVIGIELAVVALALLVPRVGWWLVAIQFAVFLGVLGWMLSIGAESCGCFGSSVKIEPTQMMIIDGALLLLLLATRPWRSFRPGAFPIAVGALAAIAVLALPWFLNRQATAPDDGMSKAKPSEAPSVATAIGAAPAELVQEPLDEPATEESAELPEIQSGTRSTEEVPPPRSESDQQAETPLGGRKWVVLPVEEWTDKILAETELADWVDLDLMPQDGLWVFYRMTCDHCADHLRELWATEIGQRPVALIRILDKDEAESAHVVEIFPEGPHVTHLTLPTEVDWIVETPAEFELVAGYVLRTAVNVR